MAEFDTRLADEKCFKNIKNRTHPIHSETMPSFGKCSCSISYVLNSFLMFWAQVLSNMQELYVSAVRFCAWIFRDTLKNVYDRIFLSNIWMKMDRYLQPSKWLSLFLSRISHWRGRILTWICRKGASIVLQAIPTPTFHCQEKWILKNLFVMFTWIKKMLSSLGNNK